MLRPPLLALSFVLLAASEWQIVPASPPICAVDRPSCEAAIEAAKRGWIELPPNSHCEPAPQCFPERAWCIPHYSGSRSGVTCKESSR